MSFDLPFRVMLRGIEVGRYASAETAIAAARSVIDVELDSRTATSAPAIGFDDLPLILRQPPEEVVDFDAQGYVRERVRSRTGGGAPVPQIPTPPPPYGEPILPRGPVPSGLTPPAPVYGGPPIAPAPKPRRWFSRNRE